ncbi:imelysin family protein [Pseudomaricurvus sp. HS19]|uniref:imelysin family protein n=1 Tax=Pseudomaricurvus sp. HS19 TaxID=2692626 RepID=UPI00136CE98A|nr:imelysin family protein [Pseudomaricurvus sp. HS19]MYM63492.1 hypothetical protein [Pseudomaricurvus sp. HS19]
MILAPRPKTTSALLLATLLCLWGCDSDQPATSDTAETTSAAATDQADAISNRLWQHFDTATASAISSVVTLQQALQALAGEPTDAHLQAARDAWRNSHQQLLQLSPLFALGQVQATLFRQLDDARWQSDAWPIEPGYLDYFDLYRHSGLVNDIVIPIDAEAVRHQHGFSSEADVALGLHAMEYLLWGEKGERPLDDFVAGSPSSEQQASGMTAIDLPGHRRVALLQLQANLLLEDLGSLQYRLSHPASGLRKAYQSLPPSGRLQLWQQASAHLLQQLQAGGETSPSQHAPFAGDNRASIRAQLQAIDTLLSDTDETTPALLQWLTPQHQEGIARELQALMESLADSGETEEDPANLLSAEQRQQLEKLSQGLK